MKFLSPEYISMAAGFLVILIGIWGILANKNLIRMIIGFSLFDTGIHIVMVAISYLKDRTAPIIDETINTQEIAKQITDPVPQALVLTAIVIGLGVTALMLVYAMKLHK